MSRRPPAPTRTSPLFPYTPLFRSAGLDPSAALDARSYDLATVSIVMVVLLVALMMTGMPLGIVTLIVSVLMAVAFFGPRRSEEHTSELQSLMRISYAVLRLKKKTYNHKQENSTYTSK